MSTSRTIAIVGHSGRIGKGVVQALGSEPSVTLRVLHRAGSDVSNLPAGTDARQVDYADVEAVTEALRGVDVLISTIGGQTPTAYLSQLSIIDAAVAAKVEYFLPSDFGPRYNAVEAAAFASAGAKAEVQKKLASSDIKFITLHSSAFAEFAFGFTILGIDVKENKLNIPGDNNSNRIELNTMPYAISAVKALLTTPDLSQYANKEISIVEFSASANEIAQALENKHGKAPEVSHTPDAEVKGFFEATKGSPAAFVATARYCWLDRGLVGGGNVFEFGGKKKTLDEFVKSM